MSFGVRAWSLYAAADPTANILDFAKYGILGAILVLILLGWLWPKPSVVQLQADKERETARADKLQETVEAAVPALADAAAAFRDVKPLVEQARDQGRRVEELLTEMRGYLRSGGRPA